MAAATGALAMVAALGAATVASATPTAPVEPPAAVDPATTVDPATPADPVTAVDASDAFERATQTREMSRQKLAALPSLPDTGQVDSWPSLRAQTPGRTSGVMFYDPADDVNGEHSCSADILGHGAVYGPETVALRVHMGCGSDPLTTEGWLSGHTAPTWVLDTDLDGAPDVYAETYPGDGRMLAGVFRLVDDTMVCQANGAWDGASTYSVSFPHACLGSPAGFRLATEFLWDHRDGGDFVTCCSWDYAPDDRDFDGPIYAPTNATPTLMEGAPGTVPSAPEPPVLSSLGDGPGAVSPSPGVVDVFARSVDDELWVRHRDGSWTEWTSLGGSVDGTPAAASAATGTVDVFVRGTDKALWTQHYDGSTWGGWRTLGGDLSTPPAVTATDGVLHVFVAGADKALYGATIDAGAFSGWRALGGVVTATPAAASAAPGTVDVFVRGADDALWTQRSVADGWTGWSTLGGAITSAPAAASSGDAVLDVFARGGDNALWSRSSEDGAWGGWLNRGGRVASPPAAVSSAAGTVDVFVRSDDSALWTTAVTAEASSGWTSLGGTIR